MGGRQAVGRVASGRWSGVVAILAMVVAASGVVAPAAPAGAVTKVSSSTALAVDISSSVAGQPVTLTAHVVSSVAVSGSVTFRRGTTSLGRGVRCRGDRVPGHCCLAGGVMVVDGDLWRFDDCVDVDVGQRVRVGGQGDKHDGLVDGSVRQRRWSAGHLDGDRHGERVGCAGADGQGGVQERVDDRRLEGSDERPRRLTTSTLPVGSLTLTAVYGGSTKSVSSTSLPVAATVMKAVTSTSLLVTNLAPTLGRFRDGRVAGDGGRPEHVDGDGFGGLQARHEGREDRRVGGWRRDLRDVGVVDGAVAVGDTAVRSVGVVGFLRRNDETQGLVRGQPDPGDDDDGLIGRGDRAGGGSGEVHRER